MKSWKLTFCIFVVISVISPLIAAVCQDIANEVHMINNEQDYYNSSYLDAQSVSDYNAMGEILGHMSENNYRLGDLAYEWEGNNCDGCSAML